MVLHSGVLSTSSNLYLSHFLASKITPKKVRFCVHASLNFNRSVFSKAKIFYSNFVDEFPNFSDCLGNFICLHSDIMWDYMNRCYFSMGCDV